MKIRAELFFRHGCDLCEAMRLELHEWILEQGLADCVEVLPRDVDANPRWHQAYDTLVPVLVVNGRQVCHYFLDPELLNRACFCEPTEHNSR